MVASLLYAVGALVFLAGLVALGFGTPASALDFGNTLIIAGTTAGCGGLIVIALAAVTARLQRIADSMGGPLQADYGETTHVPAVTPAPPPPSPPPVEQKSPPQPFEPRGPSVPPEFPPLSPLTSEAEAKTAEPASEEAPPEPQPEAAHPTPEPEPQMPPAPPTTSPAAEPVQVEAAALPPKSFFESVWPEEKVLEQPSPPVPPAAPEPAPRTEPPLPPMALAPEPPPPQRKRAAILKSGVVDGMSYTLYVDGSIEAELPQGTLRFASIHELRAHLEKGDSEPSGR
jgi:hypothetical protein